VAEIKSGVTLSLKDLFSQGMSKAAGAAGGFANKTLGAIEKVDKALSGTAAKLAAFGVTLSVGAAAKGIIEMDHRMTRLGLTANASAEQISRIKKKIFEVAQASDIKIDPEEILRGLEVINDKTSDLDYAEENIRNIALAIQATGESGGSMADVYSEFQKFGYSAEQISSLMDDMVAQANVGAFSLGEFAKAAPQIFTTLDANKMGAMPENIKKINAALQIINAGVKSPTKAVQSFNAILEQLTNSDTQRDLKKMGINVKDKVTKEFRDFNDIMFEIVEKANNPRNANSINKIFNASAMQGIRSFISQGEQMSKKMTDLGDTTGLLQKQSAAMAGTLQSNIKNLQTAFNSFADSNLTKPLENLTDLLNKLAEDPKRLEKVFTGIAVGIGTIAAVKGIAGITRLVSSLTQLKSGKVNITESLNMATAMPVYVTNWGSGTPGFGTSGPQGIGAGGQAQQTELAKINSFKPTSAQLTAVGATTAVVTAAKEIPQMMNELKAIDQNKDLTAKERGKAKGGAIGSASGGIVGATAGTVLGAIASSAIIGAGIGTAVPGLGNAIGLLAGGVIGAVSYYGLKKAGRAIGGKIGESAAKDENQGLSSDVIPTWRNTPEYQKYQEIYQRRFSASDLPPQITQTGSSVSPQKVELGGHADMTVNVNISGDTPTASVTMKNNTTDFRFETGRTELVRNGL